MSRRRENPVSPVRSASDFRLSWICWGIPFCAFALTASIPDGCSQVGRTIEHCAGCVCDIERPAK